MERGNWSINALKELTYIDTLDSYERADALVRWNNKYLAENQISDFELDQDGFKKLYELFYKNINFLKEHKEKTRKDMVENRKLRKFLKH
ncbi:hypothetical protein [Halarcobacter anaerophilus]|uniref:Uncharacterized protein n=1 Tax=Halarcobacter anaerophilus TaxID=877500 RepID=A0A4Q0Y3C1_9BACT|nr:hypothetical protein [Halarcobacter anaerophilus]QDF30115.1 hypothetical protein AANAER_2669 [Halarcobacter anaerophilus]RXJ63159.1 hypothetical protein CRV06_07820 [Halarcobacter anaerophilus]